MFQFLELMSLERDKQETQCPQPIFIPGGEKKKIIIIMLDKFQNKQIQQNSVYGLKVLKQIF
ncbi:hypothetical protein pb186bvf_019200 [Paramecium bursaria]